MRIIVRYVRDLQPYLEKQRSWCLEMGLPLDKVDEALRTLGYDNRTSPQRFTVKHNDMLELRSRTVGMSLKSWCDDRGRINNWLLHSLRSDDKLAQVHRSMLKNDDLHSRRWAKVVLDHRNTDEAATCLYDSSLPSAEAIASQQSWSLESGDFHSCLGFEA